MTKSIIRRALRFIFALAFLYSLVGFCLFALNWYIFPDLINSPLGKFFDRILEFSVYVAGVPFGALGYILSLNGIGAETSPMLAITIQIGVWLVLIPILSWAMASWCDAIVNRISARSAVFFFGSFAVLCALNSVVSVEIMKKLAALATLRRLIFDNPIPSHFVVFVVPCIIMIAMILGVTLGFFGLWEFIARRNKRPSLKTQIG
jgi:hypothetical protein